MSLNSLIKGFTGELRSRISQDLFLNDKDYHSFNNVIIETTNGTTQIDHILVSKYGVFVVETKNKAGWIFGSSNQSKWTQTLRGKKYQFQNPLHQNYKHIKTLAEFFCLADSKFHSVIVFWGDCNFKTPMPENVLNNNYTGYIKSKKQILLTEYEVNKISSQLSMIKTHTPLFAGMKHKDDVKKRYASTTICPKCGGVLLEKTAHKGSGQGKKFLGCNRYPSCHYTKPLI